jgi:hypothetical protein
MIAEVETSRAALALVPPSMRNAARVYELEPAGLTH